MSGLVLHRLIVDKNLSRERSKVHNIAIEIIAKSCFKIPYLKIPKERIFITGEKYNLSAKIKNRGANTFPGGNFQIIIQWPNGLVVGWPFRVKALAPGGIVELQYGVTAILDDGPALFLAKATDINGQNVDFCDIQGEKLHAQSSGLTHVYTIIPKNAEELYQLWALVIAIISLFPIFVKDVLIPFLQWLISILPN